MTLRPPAQEQITTTELQTSKVWIDGKPIWRKVVDFGALPNAATKTVAHGASIATLVSASAVAADASNIVPLPQPAAFGWGIGFWITSTNVLINTDANRTGMTAKVVLEYTKP